MGPPASVFRYRDWQGNAVHHFTIVDYHDRVEVLARALVATAPAGPRVAQVTARFREVKRAYDPLSIFNPGVIIPAPEWTPLADLKVGAEAAPIPDDIAARLLEVERNSAWGTPKVRLIAPP